MLIKFLKFFLPGNDEEAMLTDFESLYNIEKHNKGKTYAFFWLLFQIIRSVPGLLTANLYRRGIMMKNYFKISIRNIRKQKFYYLINVSGLAVGMTSCILILLFIQDELSYDKFHENAGRIYRVSFAEEIGGAQYHYAGVPYGPIDAFKMELPEIKSVVRISGGSGLIKSGEKEYDVNGVFYADSTFFEIFSYKFIYGDAAAALKQPGTIVLTEEYSSRIFGDENPVGKTLQYDADGELLVTGVIENVPENSHLSYNFIISMSMLKKRKSGSFNSWKGIIGWAYLLVEQGTETAALERKMQDIDEIYFKNKRQGTEQFTKYRLQKLTDIHLKSHLQYEISNNGNMNYVYIFSIIAVLILIIACMNYINLSTARSVDRGKEVGLRKVLGAGKRSIIYQFLGESLLISFFSFLIAILLVIMFIPGLNILTGKTLSSGSLNNTVFWLFIPGLIFLTGIIAGSYPAFYLSAFKPVTILKGGSGSADGRGSFRKYLVVLQFAISIVLIVSTIIVLDQLNFIKNVRPGFDKEQIIVLRLKAGTLLNNYNAFTNELKKNPGILEASYSTDIPGRGRDVITFLVRKNSGNEMHNIFIFDVDHDYLTTYGINILQGRNFSREFPADEGTYLINETGSENIGWNRDALGKEIYYKGRMGGRITGIINDFNFRSLKESIESFVLRLSSNVGGYDRSRYLSIRLNTENLSDTMKYLENKWNEYGTGREFDYFFMNDYFNSLYQSEEKLSKIITVFASVAVFIACLGLFGLACFTTEQRTKEIGIRKILGASISRLVLLLSREFTGCILAANIIALPTAYFIMTDWMQNFAYQTSLRLIVFLLSGLLVFFIAIITVSYQSVKAAAANPVDSLRYE
ncbi:ABC transporter permease [candidate division KSB1 bacterium]